jgi:hypothetical protein
MNIFARELPLILEQHHKTLENLYRLPVPDPQKRQRLIRPNKITRLRDSLKKNITATLSAEELEQLQQWVPLDREGEELRHLRAALVAEAVRAMMAGRTDAQTADQIGEMTLRLLLNAREEAQSVLSEELLDHIRNVPHEQVANAIDSEQALEPATEAYERGLLWLEVARETVERSSQQGFAALAQTFLNRASTLATNALQVAQSTTQQAELLMNIEAAKAELTSLF